jgi:DNA-binding FadR family transcriptional regulator
MSTPAAEPQRLYRQIAEQLRSAVLAGEFTVGDRLPAERDLSRQLGVSRPSLREALIALEVEGMIEVRTGSGIYVLSKTRRRARRAATASRPEWGPLQLMRARELVEGEVAALAARHAKKADMTAIGNALTQMQEELEAGREPRRGDEVFHNAIAQACGNEVLRDTVQGYWRARYTPMSERLGDHFETRPSWLVAIREHTEVLNAIRARDADAARLAMQRHLHKAHARYTANWHGGKHDDS